MAILTKTTVRSTRDLNLAARTLIGESVSWDSIPGRNVSTRPKDGVPAGRLWQLQSVYAHNAEPGPCWGVLLLLDPTGTDHARFGPAGVVPVEVLPGQAVSWTGSLWVPAGWRVGVRLDDMAGGGYCHWRYTAIEL